MSESTEMIVQGSPKELFRHATDVAGMCGEIVKRTAKRIGPRRYVCVEGWQAIATTHGCTPSIDSVTEDEQGNVFAVSTLRRIVDGMVIARAEGFVGIDEPTWAKRPRYARRAMAQTRAMSRVCRSAFAHVVVMIDSGLSTTPAEEMYDIEAGSAPDDSQTAEIDAAEKLGIQVDEAFAAAGWDSRAAAAWLKLSLAAAKVNHVGQLTEDQRKVLFSAIAKGQPNNGKKAA